MMRNQFILLIILLVMGLLSGCAHVKSSPDSKNKDVGGGMTRMFQNGGSNSSAPQEILVRGVKLQNTQFDIPITVNARVEYWIDYFQGKGRKYFEKYLERSTLFIPYITPLLKQNGMPEDLVYLAMIESGFNNHARSHAKAVGPWQFISGTGKRYGLMVNWWVDERRDTQKSTLAAVQYLKDLYQMFQSWELAAAAYNAGEAKVARAIRRYGTRDFWALARHRFFRPETRDYVPKIIAAALIAKNPEQFGFAALTIKPAADEVIAGDGSVVKVEKETEAERLTKEESEETLATVIEEASQESEGDEGEADFSAASPPAELLRTADSTPRAKPIPTPHISRQGELSGVDLEEFEVQSPADLLQISRAAELSYQTVKSLNPELLRWCTPPSAGTYRIKLPASVKEKFLATYNHSEFPKEVQFLTYKVRRGETLSHVARRFGIRVDPISDLNRLSPRAALRNGVRVILPLPSDRSRSLASLEVRDPPERRRVRRSPRKPASKYNRIILRNRVDASVVQPIGPVSAVASGG